MEGQAAINNRERRKWDTRTLIRDRIRNFFNFSLNRASFEQTYSEEDFERRLEKLMAKIEEAKEFIQQLIKEEGSSEAREELLKELNQITKETGFERAWNRIELLLGQV